MLPDRVSNQGPRTYESGALPIALRSLVSAGSGLWKGCREQSCGEKWSQSKGGLGRGVESRAVVRTRASQRVGFGGGVESKAVVKTEASKRWIMEWV